MPTRKDDDRIALLQGTLDLLILRTLLLGPRHGQGISRMIQQMSESVLVSQRSIRRFPDAGAATTATLQQ